MAREVAEINVLVKRLVKKITQLEEKSPNFPIAEEFVTSNLKHHRFLEQSQKIIKKDCNGIADKFEINGHTTCSDNLRSLIRELPEIHEQDTSAEWNTLRLLLLLSNAPTQNPVLLPVKVPPQLSESEILDWDVYLKEGLPVLDKPSPLSSDDDGDDNDDDTVTNKPGIFPRSILSSRTLLPSEMEDRDILKTEVMPEYWKNNGQDYPVRKIQPCWCHSFDKPVQCEAGFRLSEQVLVREAVWILMGAKASYIKIMLESNVSDDLIHMGTEVCKTVLKDFYSHAATVQDLRYFSLQMMHEFLDNSTPRTYGALAAGLTSFFNSYTNFLLKIQNDVVECEVSAQPSTLLNITKRLKFYLKLLELLGHVKRRCIISSSAMPEMSVCEKSGVLLDGLCRMLMSEGLRGFTQRSQFALIFMLLLRCLEPSLRLINIWVSTGIPYDPGHELCIKRNTEVPLKSEDYWTMGFEVLPEGHTVLKPVVPDILEMFRIVEILRAIEGVSNTELPPATPSINQEFVSQLYQDLEDTAEGVTDARYLEKDQWQECLEAFDKINKETEELNQESAGMETVVKEVQDCALKDGLIRSSITSMFDGSLDDHSKEEDEWQMCRTLPEVYCLLRYGQLLPFPMILKRCLFPPLIQRSHMLSQRLVQVLKHKCNLLTYLDHLKFVHLLSINGKVMKFYTELFHKMYYSLPWRNEDYLNDGITKALQENLPELVGQVFISVSPHTEEVYGKNSMELEGVNVEVKVSWPLNLLASRQVINMYSQILKFVLHLKYSNYCLQRCIFPDVADAPAGIRNVAYYLRFHLLHFVGNLHGYIMTRVLQANVSNERKELEKSEKFSNMMETMDKYTKLIHNQCFLTSHMESIFRLIVKVFDVAMSFSKHWQGGLKNISIKELQEMNKKYSRCKRFLKLILDRAQYRGEYAHIELLRYTLL